MWRNKSLSLLLFLAGLLCYVPAQAAARFAVCSVTCTWDNSSTVMWSTSSGGATGASAPVAADTVTFDAATCVGGVTCTTTVNANISISTLTFGACTASTAGCVIDFSANNNNISVGTVTGSGTGTRTLNMGNGTWTLSTSSNWAFATTTNLTFAANSSTLVIPQISTFNSAIQGALTFNIVTVTGANGGTTTFAGGGNQTIATLNYTPPGTLLVSNGQTLTLTNGLNVTSGSLTNMFTIGASTFGGNGTYASTVNSTVSFAIVRDATFSGGGTLTANNSVSGGHTTGVTVNVPASGGGGKIIGG